MITLRPVIDFSAAELADSMLVDRPDGLTVPVNDARQGEVTQILCSSVDEHRKAHGETYRSLEPAYQTSPHALRPVAFGETDAEIHFGSTLPSWHDRPTA